MRMSPKMAKAVALTKKAQPGDAPLKKRRASLPKHSLPTSKESAGEAAMASILKALKLPHKREHKFHSDRLWRFDFALEQYKLAIEVEGGVHSGGRHTRGVGFEKDCIKYNEAAMLGWTVIRFPTEHVKNGIAHNFMLRYVDSRNRQWLPFLPMMRLEEK